MPDDKNSNDDKSQKSVTTPQSSGSSVKTKEQEPAARAEEDKLMAEIVSTSEAMDAEALAKLQKESPEIKRAQPEAKLPPDVEDAGVKVPEEEADKVVKNGTTLSLPVSEDAYNKGLQVKVIGKVVGAVGDKIVVGVSSIGALALWAGRLLKMAHKHAIKVIFRRK